MTTSGSRPAGTVPPFRLGFAVKILGGGGLRSADLRTLASGPHLRESARLLAAAVPYLRAHRLGMYRIASGFAPYGTHPDHPALHWRRQHAEAAGELDRLATALGDADLRISTHPSQYVVLNSPVPDLVARSIEELHADAALLDRLGAGPTGVVVVHVGGAYGDRLAARDRFIRAFEAAPEQVRRRLVLENDEHRFGLGDVLAVHARCGIPVCLDLHHLRIHRDDAGTPFAEAMRLALATFPAGVRPKVHLSSARPGARHGAHADRIEVADLIAAIEARGATACDIMLETKDKDLALLAVRAELARLRPDLAAAEELPVPRA